MLLRHAGDRWLTAAEKGRAVTRSAAPYRPSTLRGYRQVLERFVSPELGDRRLDQITRADILALIGRLRSDGCAATTVRNAIVPLRAIYRWANDQEWTTRNPTRGIPSPGVSSARRERFATPAEARALLDAVPEFDRPLWATAIYAGLRRGALLALRWQDVDLGSRTIRVTRSYDPRSRQVGAPKINAGDRDVPIPDVLLALLTAHAERRGRWELVFARGSLAGTARSRSGPFAPEAVLARARVAWAAAGLEPIGLHEGRHTYASSLLAAGVELKTISALLGHSSIAVTADIYSHLQPDARRDAIGALDRLLAEPLDGRVAQLDDARQRREMSRSAEVTQGE
jgi:integrase